MTRKSEAAFLKRITHNEEAGAQRRSILILSLDSHIESRRFSRPVAAFDQ